MHRQVSEKRMATNQFSAQNSNRKGSADRAFRSAALDSQETITKGNGLGPAEEAIGERMAQKDRTNPVSYLESWS
jgi:hypothetical protein